MYKHSFQLFILSVKIACTFNQSGKQCGSHSDCLKKIKSRFSRTMVKIRKSQRSLPYLAYTFGSTPSHSLISTGNLGLLFFRATYCVSIKSLKNEIKKNLLRPNNILFLRPSLICFKCPSSVFFSDLNEKKEASWHLLYSYVKIKTSTLFYLKWTKNVPH